MSTLWRFLLLISWLVLIRADEICCCPDLNVRLQCTESDFAKLDDTGYRCVVLSDQTVTLRCDVADVDHSAIASVEYQYYRTYKINQEKPAPYEDAASVYKQLDCDAATCDVADVQWLDWTDSSDADGLENYDNFAYMCLVEFTLIDGVSFNLTSNTMWLDVLHNDQSMKPDSIEQKNKTNINTNDPYEMLLCELPSTNPATQAIWYKYNDSSSNWDLIDVPSHPRMALVDDVIADESDDTFDVGTLVIMIFDPDEDEGLYKCNATYTPTLGLGESSEYTVSKYGITGNGQTYSGTPEVKMISAITSDEFTTVDGFVDFTCYARDTDAQDEGLYIWVFENKDANDEPLDVTTGRFESLELINHNRTLRVPSNYSFYNIPFKCNVTRDDLAKVSQFKQPVIVPKTLALPDELYQRGCFDRSENIKLFPNQEYMMGDDVEVTDYEQKLPGASDKWFLNIKSISGFDAATANATELDMTESNFEREGYGGEDSTWKCVYFSYLRTFTDKYQMLEVLKITRDDNCADLEDTFCTDNMEVTCNTGVAPQTLTVNVASGSAQCLSVELSKDGSALASHQFEKTATACANREFAKTFNASDTNEEQTGLTGQYTVTITPEGKVGCSSTVTCAPATCAKPTVEHGSVTPTTETVAFGEVYNVTCDDGYALDGANILTCGAGGSFDQTAACNAADPPEPVTDSKAGVVAGAVVGGVLGAILLTWLVLFLLKKAGVVGMKVCPDRLCDSAADQENESSTGKARYQTNGQDGNVAVIISNPSAVKG